MDTKTMRATAALKSDLLGSKGHTLREAADEIDRLRAAYRTGIQSALGAIMDADTLDEARINVSALLNAHE